MDTVIYIIYLLFSSCICPPFLTSLHLTRSLVFCYFPLPSSLLLYLPPSLFIWSPVPFSLTLHSILPSSFLSFNFLLYLAHSHSLRNPPFPLLWSYYLHFALLLLLPNTFILAMVPFDSPGSYSYYRLCTFIWLFEDIIRNRFARKKEERERERKDEGDVGVFVTLPPGRTLGYMTGHSFDDETGWKWVTSIFIWHKGQR